MIALDHHGHVIFGRFVFCEKDESTFMSWMPRMYSLVLSLMAPILIRLQPFVTKSIDLEFSEPLGVRLESYVMRLCLFPAL